MMGIINNYSMYNHKAIDQTTEQGNGNAAEKEVQIDKEILQVLQGVKDIFGEPIFLINKQFFLFIKDINC